MKHLVILLFWVIPLIGNTHCLETFPIEENFDEVYVIYNGAEVSDVYDICISSAGNGKNTLNISRKFNGTISVYHDRIIKLIYHMWSKQFEMVTDCGLYVRFKTKNMDTRDRIRGYFQGIQVDMTW